MTYTEQEVQRQRAEKAEAERDLALIELEAAKAEILRLMSEVERLEGPAFTARSPQPEAPRREP